MGMKKFVNRVNNVFFTWFLSYIIILLVPLVISTFAYNKSINAIENEINKTHMESLKQLQQSIDSRLEDFERISKEIYLNELNEGIVYSKNELSSLQRFTTREIIKDLKTLKVSNGFVEDIFIFYRYNNFVLSDEGKDSMPVFYKINKKYQGLKYNEWIDLLKRYHYKEYMPITIKNSSGIDEKSIAYMHTLYLEDRIIPLATVMILMNEHTIKEAVNGLRGISNGTVMILDEDNRILVSTKSNMLTEDFKYTELNKKQDILYDEDSVISYITSNVTNWKYISVLPKRVFLKKAKYLRNIILITVIICLVIGLLIAYILAKKIIIL